MTEITVEQCDREAAAAYWKLSRIGNAETQRRYLSGEADNALIVQAFARHRIQALEQAMNDALTALKSVQYSPAPYTDGMKAIRARFLQAGDMV